MADFDWSKFSMKIYINADMNTVYESWAISSHLKNWFLRKAEFKTGDGLPREGNSQIQIGDTYEWLWHGHPDSTVEHGVILEANGKDRLQFVFGMAGIVTVDLKQLPDVTEMFLTQSQIPTDEKGKSSFHVGCSTGWTFYFANLKSILEGGLDLRNKNQAYSNVINS